MTGRLQDKVAMAQVLGQQHQRGVGQVHRQVGVLAHQARQTPGVVGPGRPHGQAAFGHIVQQQRGKFGV